MPSTTSNPTTGTNGSTVVGLSDPFPSASSNQQGDQGQGPRDIPHVAPARRRRPIFELRDDVFMTGNIAPQNEPLGLVENGHPFDESQTPPAENALPLWVETPPGTLGCSFIPGGRNDAPRRGFIMDPDWPLEDVFTLHFLSARLAEYQLCYDYHGRLPHDLTLTVWDDDTADVGGPFIQELIQALEDAVSRGFDIPGTTTSPTTRRVFDWLVLWADIEDYYFARDEGRWFDSVDYDAPLE